MKNAKSIKEKAQGMTREKRIETAVKIINDGSARKMSQQQIMFYLTSYEQGPQLSTTDYLEALNVASGGVLLANAMN